VSPLWRDEVGAYLSPHRLCLVRMQRGARPRPVAEHEQRFESATENSWEAPLAALAAILGEASWRVARLRVVLADHWARYIIVPWVGALRSDEERLAHARELLSSAFGEGIAAWDLRIADAPPGVPRVACAMPRELINGVMAACTAHGARPLSLQPQLIDAYAAWRHSLPESQAWFVTIEQGSLAAARFSGSGWDRVRSLRLGVDWVRELRRLQTFGRLASSRPEEGRVYVDAPHSWRAGAGALVRGGGLDGLQWLEEPNTAVTTLARLGRARRLAA
jgi:hypothetical protein